MRCSSRWWLLRPPPTSSIVDGLTNDRRKSVLNIEQLLTKINEFWLNKRFSRLYYLYNKLGCWWSISHNLFLKVWIYKNDFSLFPIQLFILCSHPGPKLPVDAVLFGGGGKCLKSSSISNTLAKRDLEERSFSSNSRIRLDIIIVFLVIFFPGLDIRKIHGSHCRNTVFICNTFIYYVPWKKIRLLN